MSKRHEELISAIVELREADAARLVKEALDAGDDPLDVVAAGKEAMDTIGGQFAACEVFIPELIMAGEIMQGPLVPGRTAPVRLRRGLPPRHRRAGHREG